MNYSKMIISKIIDSELIDNGSVVVVGFSGGPDSLCLLHALCDLRESLDIQIVPVHVNHQLRNNAEKEAENAVRMCEKLDLDCILFEADCQEMADNLKISTEEAGRKIRYEIFDEVANSLVEDGVEKDKIVIAVAHNSDDQVETVLFRIIRGTGIHGLSGISKLRLSAEGFNIVRPLLDINRSDIEGYIKENKLKPNMDESNKSVEYSRNKIRLELIPYIEENYNPNIKEAIRRLAATAAADDELIEAMSYSEAEECLVLNDEEQTVEVDVNYMLELPLSLTRRIIAIILRIYGIEEIAGYNLISSILAVIMSDNPSATINLPGGIVASRRYSKLLFYISDGKENSCTEEARIMPQVMMRKEYENNKSGVFAAFDFDEFNKVYPGKAGEIVIRSRREGDYIAIKDGKRKKIQDFLVDSKIPSADRDKVKLIAIGSEILWIVPDNEFPTDSLRKYGKFSQNYQITDKSTRILFLELTTTLC